MLSAAALPPADPEFELVSVPPGAPGRVIVESYVRDCFEHYFGARLGVLMPELFALLDPHGSVTAAAGVRAASDGPLFLEQYLGRPVEQLLGAQLLRPIARSSIVEVGHVSAARGGSGHALFEALAQHLANGHAEFVACTATRRVRALLRHLGIASVDLGPARANQLTAAAEDWGSYYDHEPRVIAGPVRAGLASFLGRLS